MAAPGQRRRAGALIRAGRRSVAVGVAAALTAALLGGCGPRPGPAPVYAPGEPTPEGLYRIRAGDTLSDIALREGIDLATLADWNALEPPYRILAGGLLRVAPPPPSPAARLQPGPSAPDERRMRGRSAPSASAGVSGAAATAPAHPPSKPRRSPSEAIASGIAWQWPLVGRVVKGFDARDRTRQGIRIAARPGELVVAAASGTVGYSGDGLKGYGNLIILKHKDDYLSAYGFNRRLLVAKGEKVTRGQPIAEVGQTTGGEAQLHFEVRKDGAAVDPLKLLPRTR
ncbi:hypothetical protein CKO22_04225 [Thiococcus pfennigii]|nr:hypothetical protein [Thiococcus pfennigii]